MPAVHQLLLIDDDAQLGAPLAADLRRFDFTLECALTPDAGLARLQRGGVDAVMLPGMDGFAVCRQIRQRAAAVRDLPVLLHASRGLEVSLRLPGSLAARPGPAPAPG